MMLSTHFVTAIAKQFLRAHDKSEESLRMMPGFESLHLPLPTKSPTIAAVDRRSMTAKTLATAPPQHAGQSLPDRRMSL